MRKPASLAAIMAGAAVIGGLAVTPAASASARTPSSSIHVSTAGASAFGGTECGGNVVGTPFKWTPGQGNCAVLGSPGHVVQLAFQQPYGNGDADLQVLAHNSQGASWWYNCGTTGGVCNVPWGNVAGNLKVRAWDPLGPSTIIFFY